MEQTEMRPEDGPSIGAYLKEVHSYLEEGKIIGILGIGGVGKSTLLRAIYNSCLHQTAAGANKVLFDHVISVVVGEKLILEKLQKDITKSLNLPWRRDLQTQATTIFNFLQNVNFLLLLDDVWEEVNLEAIGIPNLRIYTGERRKQKMVFVTRTNVVCLLMGSTMTIRMQRLWEGEAWNLFKETAGGDMLDSHPRIKSRAIRVAKKCDRLPLALVVMARTMSTKRTLQEWDDVLFQLNKSKFNKIMEVSIICILKFCYDSLQDEKIKDCFICSSLWPELFRIEKDKLIMSWMGFGLIDAFDDINKAYDYGYSIITCLVAAGLLEAVQDDNNVVKMHDIIRDFALWIASDCEKGKNRWLVTGLQQPWTNSKVKWQEVEGILLTYTKIEDLTSSLARVYCPNLLSFCLQYSRLRGMPGLLLQFMPNLRYLDLSDNYSLRKIPNKIRCLVQLRYLNLSYTKISSLPEEVWQLSNLRYLLLRHTQKLVSIPSRMLSSLSKLEVLDMYPHGIYSGDELAYLPRGLKALGVKITTAQNLQQLSDHHVPIICLNMNDMGDSTSIHLHLWSSITRGCLQELKICECDNVRELVMDVNNLPRLKTLVFDSLQNLREVIWRNVVPSECFQSLQVFKIYRCHGLKNITWVLHLPCLDYLSVKECDGMEQLVVNCDNYRQDGEEVARQVQPVELTCITFPSLKSLRLLHLPKLSGISSDYTAFSFPYLGRVEIFNCPELKKFPFRPQVNCRKLNSIKCQRRWWEGIQWEAESIKSFHAPGAKVCNIEFNTLEDPDNSRNFDSSQDSDNSIDGSMPEISLSNVNIQVVPGKTDNNRITEQELKKSLLRLGPNFHDEWLSLEVLYSDIMNATNGLNKASEIGKGGYGNVYKGKLGRTMVAIKVLNSASKQGEKEFFQELEVLYQMWHPNLVKLEGACFEVRALVYEFLPNGSLEDCLKYNPNILTWQMRTRIIHEICSALIYLHSKSVVHGDLKPANILLDANFKSKLSDFGLCRFLPEEMTTAVYLETVPKGTTGYVDPWFLETWILRPGSDLYSFGITTLKLLTGMPPVGLGVKARDADEHSFWKMIDPTAGNWPFEFAKELLYWSLQCCYHNEKSSQVLKDMSTCLEEMLTEIETFQEGRFKKKEANDSLNVEEKKEEEMKEEEKPKAEEEKVEPVLIAVVLKVHIHSEAYAQEITMKILRLEGVHTVELALKASLVTVKGVFDLVKLIDYIQREIGKPVDIAKVELVGKKPEEEKGKEQEKTKNENNDDNAKEVNEELSPAEAKIEKQRKEF